MNARDWILLIVRATGFALVTATGGWMTVPLTAGVWSALPTGERHREVKLALAAVLSWSVLLYWSTRQGDTGRLLAVLGGTLQVPPVSLIVLTLAIPALLAWSASVVASALGRWATRLASRRTAPIPPARATSPTALT
jgi:hypothetical protein